MEERKQRGQIRRGKKTEGVEWTEAEEEEGTRGVKWLYRRVCYYQQVNVFEFIFFRAHGVGD